MKSKFEIEKSRGRVISNNEENKNIMLGLGLGIPHQSMVGAAPEIGDTHQGGLVFYLDGSGGGLIAAPADETASAWGCKGSNLSGAAGTAIGTGAQNTIDINAGCTTANIAADRCRDKTTGGYSDWFLPSKNELDAMHDNLHAAGLGSFTTINSYWSSSEYSSNSAWSQYFGNGSQNTAAKNLILAVRAIRAF